LGELVGFDPLCPWARDRGSAAEPRRPAPRVAPLRLGVALVLLLSAACSELRGQTDTSGAGPGPAPRARSERDAAEAGSAPREPKAVRGVAYTTRLTGIEDDALRSLLTASMQLLALRDQPPPSLAALRRRAEDDRERLQKALRSMETGLTGLNEVVIDEVDSTESEKDSARRALSRV